MKGSLGTPLSIHMTAFDDSYDPDFSPAVVVITFENTSFFLDCLHITPKQFKSYFGRGFQYSTPGGDWSSAHKDLHVTTKNERKIVVGFDRWSPHGIYIFSPSIGLKRPVSK